MEIELINRGFKRYYTAVRTPKQARYAEFMGFDLNGESFLDVNGELTDIEVMQKDLV